MLNFLQKYNKIFIISLFSKDKLQKLSMINQIIIKLRVF